MNWLRRGKRHRLAQPGQPGSGPSFCRARLKVIRPYLREGAIGAELGVFKGAFVDYLLETKPKKLYLVDPWHLIGERWRWAKGNQSTTDALQAIRDAFAPEIECGLIEPHVEFSEVFLEALPDHALDWVYIDTSHTYEQTRVEMDLALRKVKPDGFIVGDDFYPDAGEAHAGVYRAVSEVWEEGRIDFLVEGEMGQFVARARQG